MYRLVILEALPFFFHEFLAPAQRHFAFTLVPPAAPGMDHEQVAVFNKTTETFKQLDPGKTAEQGDTDSHQYQQNQRAPDKSHSCYRRFADNGAQHASGCEWQRRIDAVKAQRFHPAAGNKQDDKPAGGNDKRTAVAETHAINALIAPPGGEQKKHRPPVSGNSEGIEQNIGKPRANMTSQIVHLGNATRVRPGGIEFVVTYQHQHHIQRYRDQGQPPRFAQQRRELGRQRFTLVRFGFVVRRKHRCFANSTCSSDYIKLKAQ